MAKGKVRSKQCINDGEHALERTWLSCMRLATNVGRLQLHALAYKLANFVRTLALPRSVFHAIVGRIKALRGPPTMGASA